MLTVEDIRAEDYDTVIVASADLQGRLFGRRIPQRRFRENPQGCVDISTCALTWTSSQDIVTTSWFGNWANGWRDFQLKPDLTTLRPYPGVPRTAICLADAIDDEGRLIALAPRTILRRQLERAQHLGYTVVMASELEFYLFQGSVREARLARFQHLEPTTLIRSDYSIVGQSAQEPFILRIRQAMEAADINIFAAQAEYGLGQWEVNLEHTDALEMADRHVIYKAGVKELALQHQLSVTFMAKPVETEFGSSCHLHCSLWQADQPVFPSMERSGTLSSSGRHFLGGLIHHLDETALFFAPHVNSYKRHVEESVGGGLHAWGYDNRTATFRIIGHGPSLHIEHRFAGADANPYLAMAAIIAAGLDGLQHQLEPGDPIDGNGYEMPQLRHTPTCLGDAVELFRTSEFVREWLGSEAVQHYAAVHAHEWQRYLRAVTDWEVLEGFESV
jgi:glutamine synthetase